MRAICLTALIFACAKDEVPAATDAATATPENTAKVDLKEFETAFSEIVQTKRANEHAKRRDQCLVLEPKVAEKLEAHATDAKLQQFASQLGDYCPEAIEARKMMKKAAEPELAMPELSSAMKSMFTAASLKTDLKKAKGIAKSKGDPFELCKKIGLTVKVIGEQKKKKDKKTKKLIKEATSFCDGPAPVATVQFHLREATKAEKEDRPTDLSDHCTSALAKLKTVKAAKTRAQLEESVKNLCREVYALKPMLDSRGT